MIDTANNNTVTPIVIQALGTGGGVAISPDGRRAYVTGSASNVYVIAIGAPAV